MEEMDMAKCTHCNQEMVDGKCGGCDQEADACTCEPEDGEEAAEGVAAADTDEDELEG